MTLMRPSRLAKRLAAVVLLLLAAATLLALKHKDELIDHVPRTWQIQMSAWRHGIEVDHAVVIPMADGVRLHASLYRPKGAEGRLPTVLIRLPYHRQHFGRAYNPALFFARHGYAVLVQDLRGTGDSDGELLPWRDVADDGVATLDWIERQPWSTGKVGTFGCSALGETQLVLSARRHRALRAMIPSGAGGAVGTAAGRYSYFGVFEGGVPQLASVFGWFVTYGAKDPKAPPPHGFDLARHLMALPVAELVQQVRPHPNGYTDFLTLPIDDARWAKLGYLTDDDMADAPALVINTWGDQTVGDALALAEKWRRAGLSQKVVIAPGNHCDHENSGEMTLFGDLPVHNGDRPWYGYYLQWFDHWLKGEGPGLSAMPAYTYFMLQDNTWREAGSWPPADAKPVRWHLDSAGHANGRHGDGLLAPGPAPAHAVDTFIYDPKRPVPSIGGPLCCSGDPNERSGPRDQADIETRQDVLVYTSAPLAQAVRVAGPIKARLRFASSALDTDLVLRLADVSPDGRSISIQEGALRLRYRQGFTHSQLLTPGEPVDAQVDLRSIAYKFAAGHRIRLQITSSSFPRLERNLNTGAANNALETRVVVATNHVLHGPGEPSYIELPTLPTAP